MLFSTNPYVAGNPVGDSPAFVGRADILREVLQVLRHSKENAIVLYGQRRIGKTSVLQELEVKLPKEGNYFPIFFDLQDKAQWPLAWVLRELAQKMGDKLGQMNYELGDDPETTFRDVWLPNLLNDLPTDTVLVFLFDEFDVLADPESEQAGADFFPYLRDLLFINQKHLNFIFVIGRKVDDLTTVALSLFRTTRSRHVSLLDQEDTIKLIRLSEVNNSLIWPNEAIEQIWQLTNGHPLLTQHLCSRIWEHLYENDPNEAPTVTLKDVNAAIRDVLSNSGGILEWMWAGLPPAERVVISALASAGAKPTDENQLERLLRNNGVQVVIRELQNALRLLQNWDLIEEVDDGYRFRVELLRRWIADYKPLSQVQEELDRIQPLADSLYQAGIGYYRAKQLNEAISILQQAINSNPNHVGANQLLAEILLTQGEISEAYKLLERLYEYQPAVARPRLIQTLLTLAQGNHSENEQIKFYQRILELDSGHQEAENRLQQILQRQQKNLQQQPIEIFMGTFLESFLFLKSYFKWFSAHSSTLGTCLRKSLTWYIFTFFFGLLPLWLVLWHSFIIKSQFFQFIQFITNGTLLFFVTAIVASITMDFVVKNKYTTSIFIEMIFYISSMCLLLICTWLFSATFGKSVEEINFEILHATTINILLMIFIYVILVKSYINFLQEFSIIPRSNKNLQWQIFLNTLRKSVIWVIMTWFYGLLPLWLVLASNLLLPSNSFHFETFFGQLIMDGALLFFSTAIVSSLTIDHYFLQRKKPYLDFFITFPYFIVMSSAWLFTVCYGREPEDVEFNYVVITEISIFTATLIYAFGIKFAAFNTSCKG